MSAQSVFHVSATDPKGAVMPDPVITGNFRAMAVFQGKSGFPEDRFINSWGFRNTALTGSPQDVADTIGTVLDAFYFGPTPSARPLSGYMHPTVDFPASEYRVYDLGQAPPRDPYIVAMTPGASTPSGSALPAEVAAVLSFVGAAQGWQGDVDGTDTDPINLPRRSRRGRIYLGPLGGNAAEQTSDRFHISSTYMADVVDRALNVLNTSENVTWRLVSPTMGAVTDVTGGWIDDAFDTQRRRGLAPTTRSTWGAYTFTG